MNENLKYSLKLSSIAIGSFLKINILAVLSTVIVVSIEFYLLSRNINAGNSAHAGPIPFLIMMFLARPVGSILWYLTCICSPFLFFAFGNKYIISKLAHKLINDKSESVINPILDKVLQKFKTKQPEVLKSAGDYSLNKLKLINDIKNDTSENKWLRRVITFGMEKIKIDDSDLNDENLNFFDIIKSKTIQSLKDISEPSRKPFWILLGIQWLFLLFIWLTKY